MIDYELVQNRAYDIAAKDDFFNGAKWVRREHMPIIGGDWETFYKVSRPRDETILRRIRIPCESITEVKDNKIISNGELIINVLPRSVEKPIVKKWVEEVFWISKDAGF